MNIVELQISLFWIHVQKTNRPMQDNQKNHHKNECEHYSGAGTRSNYQETIPETLAEAQNALAILFQARLQV